MKKITALILLAALCMTMGACNKKEPVMKTDIIGEWMAPAVNAAATFLEDGTGVIEFNGKQNVTWSYDPEQDSYVITGQSTNLAVVGKEYDMDLMSVMGIDFYRPDDYDKAYTLMLSKRFEDISIFTENMEKIELNKKYDLLNAVTIEFTEVTRHESDKGLLVSYTVTNNRKEAVTEGLRSVSKGKGYFADQSAAVDLSGSFQWAEAVEAGESVSDVLALMYHEDILATLNRHGNVIGAICFEFSGKNYYFDLTDWLK